ncbi:LRRC46 [Branchiostoma lanceolatum]|uniref:LRRC46 protein n=1 Tax=Branchiostoma lanceolatum TaxID=7740 RepID=A0A8J9W374_BRALA|nr:LRRC46 [Branchiostoma lanceolatum]
MASEVVDLGDNELWKFQAENDVELEAPKKTVRISVSLIAKRNLPAGITKESDKLVAALMKLTHLRLDRENIGEIDNLECLGPITNIYLQQNKIKKIENLESLTKIRFLCLAGNQITEVENLHHLTGLGFLDLSDNKIDKVNPEELPKSLVILTLNGNPCTVNPDHRKQLIQVLPRLQQLDGQQVTRQEKLEAGLEVSDDEDDEGLEDDDEEEEGQEEEIDAVEGKGMFHDVTCGIVERSHERVKDVLRQHKDHMTELEEVRSQSALTMAATPRLSSRMSERSDAD